jgi:hypothetical protein
MRSMDVDRMLLVRRNIDARRACIEKDGRSNCCSFYVVTMMV